MRDVQVRSVALMLVYSTVKITPCSCKFKFKLLFH